MSLAALSMRSMVSKESHSFGHLILDSIFWGQISGPRCFNCNRTYKIFSLAAFSGKGATPRSARWPTQALLCLPWGAQHTVSVTKMRALEMLRRQWGCMAPAPGSAWGLEHHNPVACVFHTHVFSSGSSLQQNWCAKAFYQNDNVDQI